MKKFLLTLVLLVGMFFGAFAQKLTYQAVVRDNNQQLVVNTAVKAFVTIEFSTGTPATYKDTVNGSTNIHGLLSIEFGEDAALVGRNWEGATIAVKVVNAATPSTVYVNDEPRPVSAVPYALSVNGQSIQNYLTAHNYVDKTELDSRHYLTSDSTVITTMQGNITSNATNITSLQSGLSAAISKEKTDSTTLAGRIDALEGAAMDCNKVKDCIKDTLSKYTVTDQLCNVVNNCDLSANASLNTLLNAINAKLDSLAHVVDSLAKLPHGGGEVADGQPCPGAETVSDGTNTYNTVKIGNQCWMAQNLRTDVGDGVYPKKNHGEYELSEDEKVTYGRLYTWAAMMKGAPSTNYPVVTTAADTIVHGICPAGWHVPSNAEWTQLTTYVKSVSEYVCDGCSGTDNQWYTYCIAKALSQPTGWSNTTGCNAGNTGDKANLTGFSAVPAGDCFNSNFNAFGYYAYFWSATQRGDDSAWCPSLSRDESYVYSDYNLKDYCFSVRCLRD